MPVPAAASFKAAGRAAIAPAACPQVNYIAFACTIAPPAWDEVLGGSQGGAATATIAAVH